MPFFTFRKVAKYLYEGKCAAKQARVKIEVVKKAEKESRIVPSKHNERFDFFKVWFINVTKFFKIFETRLSSQCASRSVP